jgi:transposase-like protein
MKLARNSQQKRNRTEHWAQSRTLPAADVFRARLILARGEGKSYREIEKSMQTSAATIARWRTRFEQHRLTGPEGRRKGSRPSTATASRPGPGRAAGAAETERRKYAPVVPEIGPAVGRQQVDRAAHLDPSSPEATRSGTLLGELRPGLRRKSGGHHRCVSASVPACGLEFPSFTETLLMRRKQLRWSPHQSHCSDDGG